MKKVFFVLAIVFVLNLHVFSQDIEVQKLKLRDGTSIDIKIVEISDQGLSVLIKNNINLTVPWNYIEPETAYSIKLDLWEKEISNRITGRTEKTITDYLELADWCKKHDFDAQAKKIYEYIIDNENSDNSTARKELGFINRNGKWYKADEWEKELAEKKNSPKNDEVENGNNPDDSIRKRIRIKLKISITHKLDSKTPEFKFSEDLESIVRIKLEKLGYKVVTTNADFYIEGAAFVNQGKTITFMDEVLSVKFEGDLSFTIKNLKTDEEKKDKVVARSGRNSMKEAVDDLFEDLAASAISRILTICKRK